jgi:hypothetical protein
MTETNGPCFLQSVFLHAFIVVINAVQAVGIAYLAQRAVRKNREDRTANGSGKE